MADLPQDSTQPDLTVYVDHVELFEDVAITDPTELASFYLPTTKNHTVQNGDPQKFINETSSAPANLDGPAKP